MGGRQTLFRRQKARSGQSSLIGRDAFRSKTNTTKNKKKNTTKTKTTREVASRTVKHESRKKRGEKWEGKGIMETKTNVSGIDLVKVVGPQDSVLATGFRKKKREKTRTVF